MAIIAGTVTGRTMQFNLGLQRLSLHPTQPIFSNRRSQIGFARFFSRIRSNQIWAYKSESSLIFKISRSNIECYIQLI